MHLGRQFFQFVNFQFTSIRANNLMMDQSGTFAFKREYSKMNILIYNTDDSHSSPLGVKNAVNALNMLLGEHYAVQKISTRQVIEEPWDETSALFVLPSGDMSQYEQRLRGIGNQRIRNYVNKGGACYATESKKFKAELGVHEIAKIILDMAVNAQQTKPVKLNPNTKDFLNFFPGTFRRCGSRTSSSVSTIKTTEEQDISVYCGNEWYEFVPDKDCSDVTVLSQFPNKSPAVVESHVNEGIATLVSFPIDFTPQQTGEVTQSDLASIFQSNAKRFQFFQQLLKRMNLHVNEKTVEPIPSLSKVYLLVNSDLEGRIKFIVDQQPDHLYEGVGPRLKFYFQNKDESTPEKPQLDIIIANKFPENSQVSFGYDQYIGCLQTSSFGRVFMYAETITSTQAILNDNFSLFKDFPVGVLFCANRQVSGVGRGGNTWVSPMGCLMFSLQMIHTNLSTALFIQYLMAVAIVHALRSRPGFQDLDIRIKWPNDIYTSKGQKLGGILVNSNFHANQFYLIVGVGLNVWNDSPSTCINSVIKRYNEENKMSLEYISKEELLALVMNTFEEFYHLFEKEGFQPFEQMYYKYWLHSNQKVTLQLDHSQEEVIIAGITPSGYLKAVKANTEEVIELHPDGNSFDLMKGLLKKK